MLALEPPPPWPTRARDLGVSSQALSSTSPRLPSPFPHAQGTRMRRTTGTLLGAGTHAIWRYFPTPSFVKKRAYLRHAGGLVKAHSEQPMQIDEVKA